MILEVCVESPAGARVAAQAGADRVELCADLHRGGTTPSRGAIELAVREAGCPVIVLVRPRAGDFEYTPLELEEVRRDLAALRELGAAGAAVGALTPEGCVDRAALADFVAAADGLPLTFHRAFDWSREPEADLEHLVACGVRRVLTAGGAARAEDGAAHLAALVRAAAGRLEVVVAGGVRPHNAARLVAATGARAVHCAAFEPAPGPAWARAADVPLSARALPRDDERRATSAALVRAMRAALAP